MRVKKILIVHLIEDVEPLDYAQENESLNPNDGRDLDIVVGRIRSDLEDDHHLLLDNREASYTLVVERI